MIKVVLLGAFGRMGRAITELISEASDFQVLAALGRPEGGRSATEVLSEAISALAHRPDVIIDFSLASSLKNHLSFAMAHKIPFVSGITGLDSEAHQALKLASQHIPVVYSANMSIGVNISLKLLETVSGLLQDQCDIGIQEIHHKHKKDAPSGTALLMKAAMQKPVGESNHATDRIHISSLRVGEVAGLHTVLFALPGEQIEITHKAADRSIFARGTLQAAQWILKKPPGLYDMQDVLGLKSA